MGVLSAHGRGTFTDLSPVDFTICGVGDDEATIGGVRLHHPGAGWHHGDSRACEPSVVLRRSLRASVHYRDQCGRYARQILRSPVSRRQGTISPFRIWRTEPGPTSGRPNQNAGGLATLRAYELLGNDFALSGCLKETSINTAAWGFAGGAGWGNPQERSTELIERDRVEGYVS